MPSGSVSLSEDGWIGNTFTGVNVNQKEHGRSSFQNKNEKAETPVAFSVSILRPFISETITLIFMVVFCSVGCEDRIIMKHQLS